MENTNVGVLNEKLKVSKLSLASFFIAVFGYLFVFISLLLRNVTIVPAVIAPLILMFSLIISLVLAIIDLTQKNRKKWLSIIALVLGGMYFILIIGTIVLTVLFGP